MFSKINRNSQPTSKRIPSSRNEDQPPIIIDAPHRWKAIGISIGEHRSRILRKYAKCKHNDEVVIESSISDADFSRVMSELQASGLKTNVGAAEFLHRMDVDQKSDKAIRNEKQTKLEVPAPKKSKMKLFDKRQSFRNMVAMDVKESSKKPIYRRSSDCQMRALNRASMQELETISDSEEDETYLHINRDYEKLRNFVFHFKKPDDGKSKTNEKRKNILRIFMKHNQKKSHDLDEDILPCFISQEGDLIVDFKIVDE